MSIIGSWGSESGLSVPPNREIVFRVRDVIATRSCVSANVIPVWLGLAVHKCPAAPAPAPPAPPFAPVRPGAPDASRCPGRVPARRELDVEEDTPHRKSSLYEARYQ